MANQDNMAVKIKCTVKNPELVDFCSRGWDDIIDTLKGKGFSETDIKKIQTLDSDEWFLGNLGLLFIEPGNVQKLIKTFNKAWRSFIDGIYYKDNELTVYFRSADGGSEEYFQSLFDNFRDCIDNVHIELDDDCEEYEELLDEYGNDFSIDIE